ncbi:type II secretion system protein N [Marinobacter sp. AL4B]|uniref:type II secretion system protein N n=1 Tax=Marinobacter sp. AL4B TaxID=2871173 RepID=UPI001CAA69A8|nr:type II secretion system protein N [Marinobacter sp. AL4B]MBZ0334024.1 type II secretion system protein N [Marinobacter sp. AL4B]
MSEDSPKPFFRPGKFFLLLLLGVLVFAVTLVVRMPIGWAWHQVSGQIDLPPQVQVRQVSGRLWDGAAKVHLSGFPARLQWHLNWPSFTDLTLPLEFTVSSSQSRLQGLARASWTGNLDVMAEGIVTVAEFKDLIRQSGGAMIEGKVAIDHLNLRWANERLQHAEGIGRWGGGLVVWPMGNQTGQAQFPPMQASLDTVDGGVAFDISEQGGDGPAADARILWNGMMEIRVYKRMVDLAQQPWSENSSPSDVVFRVKQPLLPGGL